MTSTLLAEQGRANIRPSRATALVAYLALPV